MASRQTASAPRAAQQRGLDTRARIVEAALAAFADLGFDGATTRDIAERAGVNQGLITYHFAGKLALWQAAVDAIFARLRDHFAARLAGLTEADAGTRLGLLVRQQVHFAAAHPELHRLMTHEGRHDGPRLQWLVERHVRPLYELSISLIADAQRAGLVPQVAPMHLHYLLLGAVAHLFVVAPECRRVSGVDPLTPAAIDAHADALTAVLFGLPPPAVRAP